MQIFKAILLLSFLGNLLCEEDDPVDVNTDGSSTETSGSFTSSATAQEENLTKTSIDTVGDTILSTIFPDQTSDTSVGENKTSDEDTTPVPSTTLDVEVSTETNWTACSKHSCRNGGTCSDDSGSFSCRCVPGYVGIRCGTTDACAVDDNGEICPHGACVYSDDGLTRFCKCYFGMYLDERTKTCRNPDPPCFPNPCENGGTCSEYKEGFKCECPTGYEGRTCSLRNKCGKEDRCPKGSCIKDEEAGLKYCRCNDHSYWNYEEETCKEMSSCAPNPCENSGVCEPLSSGGYNCSCPEEYSGINCETRDFCKSDESCNDGECTLSKSKLSRSCQCKDGYYLDEASHTCKENMKPCLPNPCSNDGICLPVDSSHFNCTCSEGYIGEHCESRDLCILEGGNAYCGEASCLTNSELGVFQCSCPQDQYFDYAERKCKDVDLCPLVQCYMNEICVQGSCHCREHYKWNNDTGKCEPNYCSSNPCHGEHMICKEWNKNEGYSCVCEDGYAFDGTECKEATCIFPHLNLCSQTCEISEDELLCGCQEHFELKEDNKTCLYVGNATCANKTCENGACVKEDEDETCICPAGYSELDGHCVDDCSAGKLPQGFCPDDRCEVVSGSGFRCKCEGKYVLSEDEVTCTMRKMCKESEIGWLTCSSLNATCVEYWTSPDGFACTCAKGQVKTEQGVCKDICSIEKNQRYCSSMGALCDVDASGERICKCPPFFQLNDKNDFCNKPAEFSFLVTLPLDVNTYRNQNRMKRSVTAQSGVNHQRIQNDVSKTMSRLFAEFERVNILNCEPHAEYLLCKMELQFQEISKQDLNRLKIEDLCVSNEEDEGKACLLLPSLVLRKDKIKTEIFIETTDPCDEDVKENLCGSETTCSSTIDRKTFSCTCKAGFVARSRIYPFKGSHAFIEVCKDMDECEELNPCPENSKCTNAIGSYSCSCLPGYRPLRESADAKEEKCVEQCNPNPCVHGTCTERGKHEFECSCDAGYAGVTCNLQDENFKRARINTIIVGAVLGGALLLAIIIFIASITKLRKKKFLEDPSRMLYNAAEMTERRPVDSGAINNAFQRE